MQKIVQSLNKSRYLVLSHRDLQNQNQLRSRLAKNIIFIFIIFRKTETKDNAATQDGEDKGDISSY